MRIALQAAGGRASRDQRLERGGDLHEQRFGVGWRDELEAHGQPVARADGDAQCGEADEAPRDRVPGERHEVTREVGDGRGHDRRGRHRDHVTALESPQEPVAQLEPDALGVEVVDRGDRLGTRELVAHFLPVDVAVERHRAVQARGFTAADHEPDRAREVEVVVGRALGAGDRTAQLPELLERVVDHGCHTRLGVGEAGEGHADSHAPEVARRRPRQCGGSAHHRVEHQCRVGHRHRERRDVIHGPRQRDDTVGRDRGRTSA